MKVTLYHGASKKFNSTVVPVVAETYTVEGELLDACSITQPQFRFTSIPGYSDDLRQNSPRYLSYAHVPEFDRYYFITDWTWEAPVWIATMAVDTLATYAYYIRQNIEMVSRSSSMYDPHVMDSAYPATTDVVVSITNPMQLDSAMAFTITDGTFIVGVINGAMEQGASIGAITYYAMDANRMGGFKRLLLGSVDYLNIDRDQLAPEIVRSFVNPYQYVTSCVWLPVRFDPSLYTPVSVLNLGWWQWGADLHVVSKTPTVSYSISFAIPKHPQSERGLYLNSAPYSDYALWLPSVGQIPLDPDWLEGVESIRVDHNIDAPTGKANVSIYRGLDTVPVAVVPAQLGCELQLAGTTTNLVGGAAQLFSAGSAAVSTVESVVNQLSALKFGSVLSSALSGVGETAQGVLSALSTAAPRSASNGINGAVSAFNYMPLLYATFRKITEDANAVIGRPLMKNVFLGDLHGFVKIINPKLDFLGGATATERAEILQYMESGFYME